MAAPRAGSLPTLTQQSTAPLIEGSAVFDKGNSYLKRTPAAQGNRRTWTWSSWVKRNNEHMTMGGLDDKLFGCSTSSADRIYIHIDQADRFRFYDKVGSTNVGQKRTTAFYKDVHGWYHFVVVYDTTTVIADDRIRVYINGVRYTNWEGSQTNPALNFEGTMNRTYPVYINDYGAEWSAGYAAASQTSQVYFMDGQVLGPGYFGYTDPKTNTWRPRLLQAGDPTINDGITWSSSVTGAVGNANYSHDKLFDGHQSLAFNGTVSGQNVFTYPASNTTNTFTPPSPIRARQQIRVYIYRYDDLGQFWWNGVDHTATVNAVLTAHGQVGWVTMPTKTLTSMAWRWISGTGIPYMGGIEVDGVVMRDTHTQLVDFGQNGFKIPLDGSASLGKDQSGKGNDFVPYGVNGTVPIDQATGALPILNTHSRGRVALPGVRGEKEFIVTVNGGKFFIDGVSQDTLSLYRGGTYTFNQSDVGNSSHPLRFSTTSNGTHGGGSEYTDGVATNGTPGSAGAWTKITVPHNAADTLYYYCSNHSGMGGSTTQTTDVTKADLYAWKNVLALPLAGTPRDHSNLVNCTATENSMSEYNAKAWNKAPGNWPFYGVSYYWDAGNYAVYTGDNDTAFRMQTDDFTIEGWFYSDTTSGTQNLCQIIGNAGSTEYFGIWWNGSNLYFQIEKSGGAGSVSAGNVVMGTKQWHHLAMTRTGGKMRGYINGAKVVEANDSSGLNDYGYQAFIGRHEPSNNAFSGYIQDFRIYKGIAKYTSDFAPAASCPDVLPGTPSGVSLNTTFPSLPKNGSVNFSTWVSEGGPILTGDQSTLSVTSASQTFTAEAWIYPLRINSSDGSNYRFTSIVSKGQVYLSFGFTPDGALRFYTYDGTQYPINSADRTVGFGKWQHVAVVSNGGSIKLYHDGKEVGSGSLVAPSGGTTDYIHIGNADKTFQSDAFDGFISNVRITDTAVYTTAFMPTKEPLTAISGTELLCCQDNNSFAEAQTSTALLNVPLSSTPFADSSSTGATITNTGSIATASAGTNNFNITNAASLNGSNQRLNTNNSNITFIGRWTLDAWIKLDSSASGYNAIYNSGYGSQTTNYLYIGLDDDEKPYVEVSGLGRTTASNAINKNQWYHFRATQTGVGIDLYVDGEKVLNTSNSNNSTDLSSKGIDTIGSLLDNNNNANNFHGLIGPVRYIPSNLGPPPSGGLTTDGGAVSNTANQAVNAGGNVGAVAFNPFDEMGNSGMVKGDLGNYCTWDVLKTVNPTDCKFSNAARTIQTPGTTTSATAYGMTAGSLGAKKGKWYWEFSDYEEYGSPISTAMYGISNLPYKPQQYCGDAESIAYQANNGGVSCDAGSAATYGNRYYPGDIVGTALDMDNGAVYFSLNGVWQNGGDPTSGSARTGTISQTRWTPGEKTREEMAPAISDWNEGSGRYIRGTLNCGQVPFIHSAPEGFLPLCQSNLPDPGTVRPDEYFTTTLYTGNGSTQSLTGLGFQPDLVWIKVRSAAYNHVLYDSVRGPFETLETPNGNVQNDRDPYGVTSFDKDGFTVKGLTNGDYQVNGVPGGTYSGSTGGYVAWTWKAGGNKGTWNKDGIAYASAADAGLDNTSGGSTGTDSKFAILRYTGTGSVITMGHSLGTTPACAIHKCLSHSGDWTVWSAGLDSLTKVLLLNNNGSQGNMSSGITSWNSTQLVMDTDGGTNSSGRDYLLYVWANIPGVQKFGWYAGSGGVNKLYLGFKPAIFIQKCYSASADWEIFDNKREGWNQGNDLLYPCYSNAEAGVGGAPISFVSDGVMWNTGNNHGNGSGRKYIYMAWAEQPQHNLFAGQSNAR